MKVLLSCYACEPNKGSEPGSSWNWTYYLSKEGLDVHVLTTPKGKEAIEKKIHNENIKNIKFHYVDYTIHNIDLNKLRFKFDFYFKYILWQYKIFKVAKELDEKNNYDIIHHISWGSLQLGSKLWKLGKPFIFGPVGGGQKTNDKFKSFFGNSWRIEVVRDFLTKSPLLAMLSLGKAVKKADVVLAANSDTVNLAEKNGAKNVRLMLDTSLEDSYLNTRTNKFQNYKIVFLWVGRLLRRKGMKLFLDAIKKVKNENAEFRIIGGIGECREELLEFISTNQDLRVKWLDQIGWDEVIQQYEQADVFVFTSLRDSFGSQVLEAMGKGLPVICLNQFALKDFLPDCASIKIDIDEASVDCITNKIADAMDVLCENNEKRIQMSSEAYKFACENVWSKKIQQVMQIYQNLLIRDAENFNSLYYSKDVNS